MWQTILAAMLFLQAPGKSIYSTVATTETGAPSVMAEVNGTTAYMLLGAGDEEPNQCKQEGNVACFKPRFRDVVYNGYNLSTEWQRTETYDEGVQRYSLIAHAIDDVLKEQEWRFPAGRLWRLLLSIAYHESGFRRDIHTGIGSAALGDCKWRGKKLVKGSCKSHGLFQALFATPKETKLLGYGAREIVGDDLESTKRSVRLAAGHLDRLHRFCTNHGPRPFTACVFASYGGVNTTSDPRIQKRVATYNRIEHAPHTLDDYVKTALGISGTRAAVVASREE